MTRNIRHLLALLATLVLVAAACSSSGGSSDGADEPSGSGAVDTLEGVQSAVIQIEAQGSFAQPAGSLTAYEEGEGAGRGSGFIISESGLAVTNNHVVTGNATLEVAVDGREDTVNAKVLGVSECTDLAVIDLDGDGYPYLDWYDGEMNPGLEVRSAGFPLGDPEYTLTSGIISKADANGDTNWASVDSVIEHDAAIQPGNSGGPLVDAETGHVVAVNYAGGDPGTGTSQYFAVGAELAEETVEELKEGDSLSLGVNGQAVIDEELGLAGIWVSSVDTNSPAGELGLQGGDIIERIEGLTMGADGTMADYCDVLRSRQPSDKLAVQVLRFEDNVRLEGEFNGDELAEKELLSAQVEAQTGEIASDGQSYASYVEISDDSGTLFTDVPAEWSDVDGSPLVLDDGTELPSIVAAPSISALNSGPSAPGVAMAAVPADETIDDNVALDEITASAADSCTDAGREPYSDELYTGVIQFYSDCGGSGAAFVGIVAGPPDGSFRILVAVQLVSEADLDALDQIIATFRVDI